MTGETLGHALRCAERGWRVFPCGPGAKTPVAGCHWPDEASRDPDQIARWWQIHAEPNYGIVTGETSAIFVVDLDRHGHEADESGVEDGLVTLATLENEHDEIPPTLTVRTPSGGFHLYFQYPEGGVRNSARRIGPGIDVRGDGGYVVGPGSIVDGRRYTIVDRWRP